MGRSQESNLTLVLDRGYKQCESCLNLGRRSSDIPAEELVARMERVTLLRAAPARKV
jgi:hypothetical protein